MDINYEYVNPFDEKINYLLRVEHLGRYYFAREILKNSKMVLDAACADGYGTYVLSKIATMVCGMDCNSSYLDIASKKYNAKNIIYKQIDFNCEKINGKYDGIVCFETLEHLKYPEKFLKNLYDILDENGKLILSVPNSIYEKSENGKNIDSYHINVFSYNNITDLIKKTGFIIQNIYGQSFINRIVNKELIDYKTTNIENDAKTIGYPSCNDIHKTYSYIFILSK